MPVISNLKKWRNGEIFNARDYIYERDLIVSQLNRLTAFLGDGLGKPVIHYETLPNSAVKNDLFIDYD
jgi:hypothetical protein